MRRHIGTLRTVSFAVGLLLGLVSTIYVQPRIHGERVADLPGLRLALDQWPIVSGHRRQPTAVEIDPPTPERGTVPSAPRSRDGDRAVQQLYDEIMRRTDPVLRP